MTTPSEGRPGWEQGSWGQSMDWLSNLSQEQQQNLQAFVGMTPEQRQSAMAFVNLDDRQQANLMRAANSDPLRTRVENAARAAVARVHLAIDNTRGRISDMATSLASQARDTRDAVVQGARNVGDRATELGQQAVGAYEAGRDRVVDAAQRGQVRLDQAWQAGADRVGERRDSVVQGARGARDTVVQGARDTRDAVVGGARDARDAIVAGANTAAAATKSAFVKTGRWFEGKFNAGMLKAESTLANYNASRHDPSLQADTTQVFDGQSRLELIQRLSEVMNTPISAQENEAIQNLAQASQTRIEGQTAVYIAMAGVPGPGTRVPDRGQTTLGQQTGEHGAQRQTGSNLTKDNDKGGLKR